MEKTRLSAIMCANIYKGTVNRTNHSYAPARHHSPFIPSYISIHHIVQFDPAISCAIRPRSRDRFPRDAVLSPQSPMSAARRRRAADIASVSPCDILVRTETRHFRLASFERSLVFGVCDSGFLGVFARETCVDFVVERSAESFTDALWGLVRMRYS